MVSQTEFNEVSILYVEDKRLNQKVVELIMNNLGCGLEVADNGAEALRMFTPGKYNLILMDICMPIMDGIQTMKELKKIYNGYLPPVIALSANADSHEASEFIKLGMDDFIAKPVTKEKIRDILIKYLPQEV